MKFIIIFLLLIIFTPLPLKFSINIYNKNYSLKLYNYTLLKNNQKKKSLKKRKKRIDIKKAIKILTNNKFKPFIRITGSINYDLKSPMYTAIVYGAANILLNLIYIFIDPLSLVKKYKIDVTPKFKEEQFIDLKVKCIIFASIGQIIYMLLIFYKNLEKVAKYDG